MATANKYTTEFALNNGQKAENAFYQLAKSKGYDVTPADFYQETREHWDFRLIKSGSPTLKVEVKSTKNFSILDEKGVMTKDFLLVEFKGVSGRDGWAHGQADVIAFEREDGFLIVPRKTLLGIADLKLLPEPAHRREKMLYKIYSRDGRSDEVTAVLLNDVIVTRNFNFWKK